MYFLTVKIIGQPFIHKTLMFKNKGIEQISLKIDYLLLIHPQTITRWTSKCEQIQEDLQT